MSDLVYTEQDAESGGARFYPDIAAAYAANVKQVKATAKARGFQEGVGGVFTSDKGDIITVDDKGGWEVSSKALGKHDGAVAGVLAGYLEHRLGYAAK